MEDGRQGGAGVSLSSVRRRGRKEKRKEARKRSEASGVSRRKEGNITPTRYMYILPIGGNRKNKKQGIL